MEEEINDRITMLAALAGLLLAASSTGRMRAAVELRVRSRQEFRGMAPRWTSGASGYAPRVA